MESEKIITFFSFLRRMTASASEMAYNSALKMLALFGSLVVLVTVPWTTAAATCTLRILPTASSIVWNIKFIKYRENKLTVTRYVQKCSPLARTQARKCVGHWSTVSSISDCSKPRHTCSKCCRSSSMSWTWQWRHIYITYKINK